MFGRSSHVQDGCSYTAMWPLDTQVGSVLTHICLVDSSILINWMSPFPILGVSGVLFHFYYSSDRNFCMQTV